MMQMALTLTSWPKKSERLSISAYSRWLSELSGAMMQAVQTPLTQLRSELKSASVSVSSIHRRKPGSGRWQRHWFESDRRISSSSKSL